MARVGEVSPITREVNEALQNLRSALGAGGRVADIAEAIDRLIRARVAEMTNARY